MTDIDKNDSFLLYYFIGLIITCFIIGYLLYWLIKKSKEKEITKLKSKKKSIRSIKTKRKREKSVKSDELRTKSSLERKKDPQYQKAEPQFKADTAHKQQKELDLSPMQSKTLSPAQNAVRKDSLLKIRSDLDIDFSLDSKGSNLKQDNKLIVKSSNLGSTPKANKQITQRVIPFNAQNKFTSKDLAPKSILVLEPNKFLKEALNEDKGDKRLNTSSTISQSNNKSSSLSANQKMESSVMAYQTTPISIDNIEAANDNYASNVSVKENNNSSSLSLNNNKKKSSTLDDTSSISNSKNSSMDRKSQIKSDSKVQPGLKKSFKRT